MTGPMTQLIEIPLVGMTREQGQDSGGFSYALGMQNTGQNEWRPIGALSESPSYNVCTYSTNISTDIVQNPDVLLFESKNQNYACSIDKTYSINGDTRTIRDPSPIESYFNSSTTMMSCGTFAETTTLKMYDFSSDSCPSTFLYSLDSFCSFVSKQYAIEPYRSIEPLYEFSFYDKNSGKRFNSASVSFNGIDFDSDSSRAINSTIDQKFITESSDGKVGILCRYDTGGSVYNISDIYIQVDRYNMPDGEREYVYSPYISGFGTVDTVNANDCTILGYYKILSDPDEKIIDVIALMYESGGSPFIDIISRIDRVVVTTLTMSPTLTAPFNSSGSVYISDFSDDAIVCWSYEETIGPNTGVSYRKLNINKTTGVISFNGAEVILATEPKAAGRFINAFPFYDTRKSTFNECVYANRDDTLFGLSVYGINTASPLPTFSQVVALAGFLFNSQLERVDDEFICIGSFRNLPDLEYGQVILGMYFHSQYIQSGIGVIVPNIISVIGYNETWGNSYSQFSYCRDTRLLFTMCSSESSLFSRSTQIGVCDSLRAIRFNGDTYLFSGVHYIFTPRNGFQRVGTYTTPVITSSSASGVGTLNGTFTFKICYRSYGADGTTSESFNVSAVNNDKIDITMHLVFIDNYKDISTNNLFRDVFSIMMLDTSDGLYKYVTNQITGTPTTTQYGYTSFSIDASSGTIDLGDVAEFESGEAPQVGLNSPKMATLALGRIVCTDEFSEKIYTSKQQSEVGVAEFSDLLFINASPATEPITELAEINNALVVFSKDSIYAITGSLPDSFGNQSLSEWQMISNSVGAFSSSSTICTDNGVYFASSDGICLLNRGFQIQKITYPRGFMSYSNSPITQDFWSKSCSQQGTDNLIFSTSSLRSRLDSDLFCDSIPVIDSFFLYSERYGSMSLMKTFSGDSKVLGCSGILNGVLYTDKSTMYINDTSSDQAASVNPSFDTGYICPFGQFTYGQVSSVYVKMFKVGDILDPYPSNLLPYVTVYVRDDFTDSEIHETTQTMEEPIPTENSRVFLWRVRLTNRRVNAIRVSVNLGEWGLAGIALEVIPQPVGGVKRQLQGVT